MAKDPAFEYVAGNVPIKVCRDKDAFSNFLKASNVKVIKCDRIIDWSQEEGWGIYRWIYEFMNEKAWRVSWNIYKDDTVDIEFIPVVLKR